MDPQQSDRIKENHQAERLFATRGKFAAAYDRIQSFLNHQQYHDRIPELVGRIEKHVWGAPAEFILRELLTQINELTWSDGLSISLGGAAHCKSSQSVLDRCCEEGLRSALHGIESGLRLGKPRRVERHLGTIPVYLDYYSRGASVIEKIADMEIRALRQQATHSHQQPIFDLHFNLPHALNMTLFSKIQAPGQLVETAGIEFSANLLEPGAMLREIMKSTEIPIQHELHPLPVEFRDFYDLITARYPNLKAEIRNPHLAICIPKELQDSLGAAVSTLIHRLGDEAVKRLALWREEVPQLKILA